MIGILLLNLGGPDSLEAVRPFLYNLFSDREIIRLGPSFMQKPLAWLISTLRHGKTESFYSLIGGKSPILDITAAQAKALEELLNRKYDEGQKAWVKGQETGGNEFRVFVGMRYWYPFTEEAVAGISAANITKIVAIGLYPHYSVATTGSSLSSLQKAVAGLPLEVHSVQSWYDHPLYIDALVEKIKNGLASFKSGEAVPVLFSAHSLPQKFIEDGDPYVDHIQGTIRAVLQKIPLQHHLSYQSKSGPVAWLEPSTEEMIERLAKEGVRNLLVVPISFVSDHIETLYEIDILYKRMAEEHGIELRRIESLNTTPLFIEALADIALKATREAGWTA
ncbi:MAG: ferrochelatase [Thermodesulfovibrio sp.]|nr:ferrochelatase [Thermodesulfovibrio sp.]